MNWKVSIFGICPSVSLRYPPHGKTSMPLLLRGSQEKEQRIFHPFWYSLKMGIEKGRPSEQSPKMKGIFYEAMQEKKLSESQKPLILLGFSKSSVSPLAPEKSTYESRCFFQWNQVFYSVGNHFTGRSPISCAPALSEQFVILCSGHESQMEAAGISSLWDRTLDFFRRTT